MDRYRSYLRVFSLVLLLSAPAGYSSSEQSYVAFSLREAARQTQAGHKTRELRTLAGMTRVVGLVHDPGGDIILVGRVIEGLAGVTLDDLVVALRARLVRGESPTVSIDPTDETQATGLLKVRFLAGIEGTAFGRDFLECDVSLKRYSLSLLPAVSTIPSYRTLVGRDLAARLRAQGVQIRETQWYNAADLEALAPEFHGRGMRTQESRQTRFWFTPLGRPRLWLRDGVACIRELRLGVQQEILGNVRGNQVGEPLGGPSEDPGELFARQFTRHMREAAAAQPILQRLKILFDLTAVAELVPHLENPPDLSFFLWEYPVPKVITQETCELSRLVGVSQRSDGLQHVTEICGGIEFKMDIEWLNRGDCSFLRAIVLKTRPGETALTWTLPLDAWHMPNSQDLEATENAEGSLVCPASRDDPGCSVFVRSSALEPPGVGRIGGQPVFTGFASPPGSSPGGVSIRMEISNALLQWDNSGWLERDRERALTTRPDPESLSWPMKQRGWKR